MTRAPMKRKPVHGIWLDDVRPNPDAALADIHARNFSEFREALNEIEAHGETIDFVSFDYMLNEAPDPNWPPPYTKTGRDCAELLMMYDGILAPDFHYEHHSSSKSLGGEITTFLDALLRAQKGTPDA